MNDSPPGDPGLIRGIRSWIPWMVQALLLGIVAFVPFGFDRPSSAGLDFDDFMVVAMLFCVVGAVTTVCAILGRRWRLLAAEILIAMAGVLVVFGGFTASDSGAPGPTAPAEVKSK